jgi:hypothetical protein
MTQVTALAVKIGPDGTTKQLRGRRAGFVIDTEDERHGRAFAGRHARYHLRSTVTIVTREMA